MSFTPGINANKINKMLDKYDDKYENIEEIQKIIFNDEFFENQEDKDTNILIASALTKIMAFCANKYYSKDGCSKDCPIDCIFTDDHRFDRGCKCTLCVKSLNKDYDKNMTRENAYKAFYSIFCNLEDECDSKCHICRCPFYMATGVFKCDEQIGNAIIYD